MTTNENETVFLLAVWEREYSAEATMRPVRVVADKAVADMWLAVAKDAGSDATVIEVPFGMPGFVVYSAEEVDRQADEALAELREQLSPPVECPGTADGRHEDVLVSLPGSPEIRECRACGNVEGN